jgi:PAS domain S-box-containing protein
MDNLSKKVEILEKALEREKKARKKAEDILEEKSTELYALSEAQKTSNQKLSHLLKEKTNQLEGVFTNILDAYVVIDISGYVLTMNDAAIQLLGFDHKKENVNLIELVKPESKDYTLNAFRTLYEQGTFSNYKAKLLTKNNQEKIVQINASIIYDDNDKPIAAQGIARDITNARQTHKKRFKTHPQFQLKLSFTSCKT